ncbi:ATP-binding protein [Butyricicoccus sp. 1XD8-22]|nr:ATP-binding protein [Butyricicoccus sp. 1XD8-22]
MEILLFLDGCTLAGQALLHTAFLSRLCGKPWQARVTAAYLLLICAIQAVPLPAAVSMPVALAADLAVLYALARLHFRCGRAAAATAALLATYITQISFGMVTSVEVVLLPPLLQGFLLYAALLLAVLAAFAVCAACYALVLRAIPPGESLPSLGLLIFPGAFCWAAEIYIQHTAYSVVSTQRTLRMAGVHLALLAVQALGLASLLCTLYAYRRACRGIQAQAELDSLGQAARAQKAYVAEAQARDAETRAFRHDFQNHLAVLRGLLSRGETAHAARYLERLEGVSAQLSLPVRTGSPAVDVLLSGKLARARAAGIRAEVLVQLPPEGCADSFDLCVVFANALDNAIEACRGLGGEPLIRVTGARQGDFLRLSFENPCGGGPLPPMGTGLRNIQAVAAKYQGTMIAEQSDGRFRLDMLLNIPLPKEVIPEQNG